ncbi:MAG: class I SAM-dependent methyltransferase [bacterium]
MQTTYSKPSAHITPEIQAYRRSSNEQLERQWGLVASLAGRPMREVCILCGGSLTSGERMNHRGLEYVFCPRCEHLQTRLLPPPGYPTSNEGGITFDSVYPPLDENEFRSRRDRIYAPKLEWALGLAGEMGKTRDEMLGLRWVEIGCGAGYFLSALQEQGAETIMGLEAESELVERANAKLVGNPVLHWDRSPHLVLSEHPADIYTAFFVMEHIENAGEFFRAFAKTAPGTLLLFSVPAFGLSALLDNVFEGVHARMLDGAVHTQLYTDSSVGYALRIAGCRAVGEWVFGADSIAFIEHLRYSLIDKMEEGRLRIISEKLQQLMDPLQVLVDRLRFADERHVLAVRTEE